MFFMLEYIQLRCTFNLSLVRYINVPISMYTQFKFIVDGNLRHDEHQPFVSGNGGVVNTVYLAREPDSIPEQFGPQTLDGARMDVDYSSLPVVMNFLFFSLKHKFLVAGQFIEPFGLVIMALSVFWLHYHGISYI